MIELGTKMGYIANIKNEFIYMHLLCETCEKSLHFSSNTKMFHYI
jgi:hypothetical protein